MSQVTVPVVSHLWAAGFQGAEGGGYRVYGYIWVQEWAKEVGTIQGETPEGEGVAIDTVALMAQPLNMRSIQQSIVTRTEFDARSVIPNAACIAWALNLLLASKA